MSSCHEEGRDHNRAGIEAAEPKAQDRHIRKIKKRRIGMRLGKHTGRDILKKRETGVPSARANTKTSPAGGVLSLRPITLPVFYPHFGQVRRDRHVRTTKGHLKVGNGGFGSTSIPTPADGTLQRRWDYTGVRGRSQGPSAGFKKKKTRLRRAQRPQYNMHSS
eukprot:gene22913-biopygen8308